MIRALVVDDEPLARSRIRRFLAPIGDIEVIGECSTGREAIETIRAKRPNLLFLDVEMPEIGGFEVLQNLTHEEMPVVIFTTAFDQYALRAFEAHAIDYLLKPFDERRFMTALERARVIINDSRNRELTQKLMAMLNDTKTQQDPPDRLVVKSGGRVIFLRVDEIDWIEAAANYVRIHTGTEAYLMRETMTGIEAKLDKQRFMRIHRSIIVNVSKIKELQPCNNGEYIVVLRNGKELSLSRSFRDRIQSFMQHSMMTVAKGA